MFNRAMQTGDQVCEDDLCPPAFRAAFGTQVPIPHNLTSTKPSAACQFGGPGNRWTEKGGKRGSIATNSVYQFSYRVLRGRAGCNAARLARR